MPPDPISTGLAVIGSFNSHIRTTNSTYYQPRGRHLILGAKQSLIVDSSATGTTGSMILGGIYNSASNSSLSHIIGGCCNHMTNATSSVIAGGTLNTSSGAFSGILGGTNNKINNHNCSFIIGADITSTANCTTFVNNFHSTGSNGSSNVVILANLPTSDPGVAGQVWRSGNDLKISTG